MRTTAGKCLLCVNRWRHFLVINSLLSTISLFPLLSPAFHNLSLLSSTTFPCYSPPSMLSITFPALHHFFTAVHHFPLLFITFPAFHHLSLPSTTYPCLPPPSPTFHFVPSFPPPFTAVSILALVEHCCTVLILGWARCDVRCAAPAACRRASPFQERCRPWSAMHARGRVRHGDT